MTRKGLLRKGSSLPILAAVAAVTVGCNLAEPPPFQPEGIRAIQEQAARQVPPRELGPLPTTLQSPYLTQADELPPRAPATQPIREPTIRMSLQEVIHRAATYNLQARVAGYDSAINSMRVIEAQARFDPTFFSNYTFERQDNSQQFRSSANPLQSTQAERWTLESGIRQLMPTGGQVELSYQTVRTFAQIPSGGPFVPARRETFFDNNLSLQLTQPLLRDFGGEVNRARITIARNDQRISTLQFRQAMEEQLARVEQTYWQLVAALRNVEIEEKLLQRTIDMADVLWGRRKQDVSEVQLAQTNASIEARRAQLVRSRARIRDLSDELKRRMNDPSLPVGGVTLILPANEPMEVPIVYDLEDQITTALQNRPELAQQVLRIDSASTVVKVARNNVLPQLNLVGQVSMQGLGEIWEDANQQQFEDTLLGWAAGLAFEVPIGNRAAKAIYRRTLLQRQQAIDEYRNLVEQVAQEVKTSQRAVATAWEAIAATRQARLAAAKALETIEVQWENVERSAPFVQLLLDRQAALASAAAAEVEAITDYNIAVARLEFAKGTLLRYNNVVLDEEKAVSR